MDLWGFEASVAGLVRDQDNQPRLHKETLSKNMNKTIKIFLKSRSHSMEGEYEGHSSGAGTPGVTWATGDTLF